jgi:hypothetical protein
VRSLSAGSGEEGEREEHALRVVDSIVELELLCTRLRREGRKVPCFLKED